MAKLSVKPGSTSQTVYVKVFDSTSSSGAGLAGLAYNTGSLTAYYVRPLGSATAITLATQTVTGAWSSGGFVEVSASNMPGVYRLDVPDAVLATGVRSAVIQLKGATNMVPCELEIDLHAEADVVQVNAASGGIARFERALRAITIGTVGSGSTVASVVASSLDPSAVITDQFKGLILSFDKDTTTAALRGQKTDITASTTGGVLAVTSLTTAPVSGDTFVIE